MKLLTYKEREAVAEFRHEILEIGELFGIDSDNIFDYLTAIQDTYPENWYEELVKEYKINNRYTLGIDVKGL